MKHVNYNNCIVGIPNSVLSYFGLKCINQSNEIIEKQLFGIGINNDKFESCLGDYIAISISDKSFKYIRHGREMLANHAGLTENEVDVPLILKYIKR